MKTLTRIRFSNKIIDKIFALIFGFALWTIFAANNTKDIWIQVPLCFYNTDDNIICNGPETVKVHLCAKRVALKNIDTKNLAIHVDSQKLSLGESNLHVTEQDLFLPDSIKLVDYTPCNIVVNVEQKVCQTTSSAQTV